MFYLWPVLRYELTKQKILFFLMPGSRCKGAAPGMGRQEPRLQHEVSKGIPAAEQIIIWEIEYMVDEYIKEVWEQVGNGVFTTIDTLPSVIYVGIKMHLEALDNLAYDIESLRNEVMKIEKKMNNEEK